MLGVDVHGSMAPPVTDANDAPMRGEAGRPEDDAPAVAAGMAAIGRLIGRGRRRLRAQGALEGATTASILASASALTTVFLVRTERLETGAGIGLLVASAGVLGAGALLGALRRLDDEQVARRIDRASGLADRLSTAVAFAPELERPATDGNDLDTRALMQAAVQDAARAVPKADVVAATPIRQPRDLRAAVGFAVVAALAGGLGIAVPPHDPHLIAVEPALGRHGLAITIHGERLCGPRAAPDQSCDLDGALITFAALGAAESGGTGPVTASFSRWTGAEINLEVPAAAPIGMDEIVVWAKGKRYGALPFEVLGDRDGRNFSADTVALDDDDQAYLRELVADLKAVAKRDNVKDLEDYAAKIEQLIDQADRGELTKEQLLAEMKKAEDALAEHSEPTPNEIDQALTESGQELAKNPLTKDLGQALQQQDLAKAKAELEKLADKLASDELTPEQQQELAKTLEKTAEQFEQKQAAEKKQDQDQQQKAEDEVKRLEKDKDQARTDEERQTAERRLEKKKQELEQLKKDQDQKDQSAERRSLERLHKDMDKAAKALQEKKQPDPSQDPSQDGHQKASRSLKDAADETGKVDGDKRKQTAEKKVASQMDDLREAMRRAKQRGQRGPKNPFGSQGEQTKQQDFEKRAQGGQGQKGAWKPGQGQGQRGQKSQGAAPGQQGQQGQDNGGQGTDPDHPSENYGDGHDPNLVGDPTGKSGNTKDEAVSGAHGAKGPSRRETILAAAQKGFASTAYKQVFTDYKDIVEAVMKSEKVPPSYKYYVKKYFTKIKPHAMD